MKEDKTNKSPRRSPDLAMIKPLMKRLLICAAVIHGFAPALALSKDRPQKIAIIKADDVRAETSKWQQFFDISQQKGVKVSAGIICDSLEAKKPGYIDWLKGHQASGQVEFWNHGWDHKRWEAADKKSLSEFGGSGYAHQKEHFTKAQAIMKRALGTAPIAFGTPYNALDADTIKVMNEDAELRLFFGYRAKGLKSIVLAPMALRGEHDGTGKPNFAKFKADYMKQKALSFAAIQFHPNAFSPRHLDEYAKIIDFLIAEGWTFMLPSEYLAMAGPSSSATHAKPEV